MIREISLVARRARGHLLVDAAGVAGLFLGLVALQYLG